MRIPVNAARALLEVIHNKSYPSISNSVENRLERIDLGMEFIEESMNALEQVEAMLLDNQPSASEWPGVSGEFAALATWMLQDLKTSASSVELDKAVLRATVERLDKYSVKGPYPPELKLKIHHWVVGACWSAERLDSAIVFPLRALSLSKDQAAIAYNGLVEQLQALEALGLGHEPGADSEMAISGVPVRVLGLAEALNPEILNNSLRALEKQITKLGGQVSAPTKVEVGKNWNATSFGTLVQERNSIAHVSRDSGQVFSKTVSNLDRVQAHRLGELASTLMAAEILFRLEAVSETSVLHWVNQFRMQLENHNLVHLRASKFNQVVTPLG